MKKLFALLLLPLLLLATASTDGNDAAKARAVKKQLQALFAACRAENHARAAKYIVYRGPYKDREWKESYDYSDGEEKERVRYICEGIGAHLALDANPQFVKFTQQREGNQEWGAWEVVFEGESQRERVLFAFIKVKGKYLLGDIDDLEEE